MPPSAITAAHFAHKLAVQGPGGFGELVKAWIDYLNSQVAGNPEFNGSFEIDSDADGDPDLWTMDIYTGGAYELDTTDSSHGKTSLKFTHPGGAGNGGGWADSDYLEASELIPYVVPFLLKNSAAGTKVEVVIRCFDEDKLDLSSDQTIYSSVANPTSWTLKFANITPPVGTKFIKIRLIGGKSDVDVAGTVSFDGVALLPAIITEQSINWANAGGISQFILFRGDVTLTGQTSYTKIETYGQMIYIPKNANSLQYRARCRRQDSGGGIVGFRVRSDTNNGTNINPTSYGPNKDWSSDTGTLDVSDKSGWTTLFIEGICLNGSGVVAIDVMMAMFV